MPMLLKGSCRCGAVRFEVESHTPVPFMLCYCSICRKQQGGGGFAINLGADYETMNLTTGPHPMKLLRERLPNIWRAIDLPQACHGATIQIAGNVICCQRPGTAKGFVFISLEDETGVSNAIVEPDLFERFRLLITEEAFLLIEGEVQNSGGVVLSKTREIRPLAHEELASSKSHDFH